jgi:hypothetical protein
MNHEQRKMNDDTGKRGRFILTLLFVTCNLLFTISCLFEPQKQEKSPEGMGWFLLVIDGVRMGRTILPSESQYFSRYELVFINKEDENDRQEFSSAGPILVRQGTYRLEVTAYKDEGKAAWGVIEPVIIVAGENNLGIIRLDAFMDGDDGTFSWEIFYPGNVVDASMTVTRWPDGGGDIIRSPERGDGDTDTAFSIEMSADMTLWYNNTLSLPPGIYRVVFTLILKNSYSLEYRETVHVYRYMDSFFKHRFNDDEFTYIIVTNGNDDKDGSIPGSLRKAIKDAKVHEKNPKLYPASIIIRDDVKEIFLKERLEIDKSLTIEGNGVTIKRDSSWDKNKIEEKDNPQLLYIGGDSSKVKVTIRRVLFKDNRIFAEGAAVYNNTDLTLESCIFSENSNYEIITGSVHHGGAVYSKGSALSVMGCTFYGNISGGGGGAIAVHTITGLNLKGNLFYNNKQNFGTEVYRADINQPVTLTLGDYNVVVDGKPPITDFKPIPAGAANVITSRPVGYPTVDFYGETIPQNNAAAGAVQ